MSRSGSRLGVKVKKQSDFEWLHDVQYKEFQYTVLVTTICAWRGCRAAATWVGSYSHIQTYWTHWSYLPVVMCSKSAKGLEFLMPGSFGRRKAAARSGGVCAFPGEAVPRRGDLSHFSSVLAPGRRWECVDRCEKWEPHPCWGRAARCLVSDSALRERRCLCGLWLTGWRNSQDTGIVGFLFWFGFKSFFLYFGCTFWQIAGEEWAWILPVGAAALNSSSPVQRLGSACWCWACFKSPAF